VAYGKIAIEKKTILDPYSISGSEIINISKERQSHEIIELMKVSAMARIFALATGRFGDEMTLTGDFFFSLIPYTRG
jgi:hypothetical protein